MFIVTPSRRSRMPARRQPRRRGSATSARSRSHTPAACRVGRWTPPLRIAALPHQAQRGNPKRRGRGQVFPGGPSVPKRPASIPPAASSADGSRLPRPSASARRNLHPAVLRLPAVEGLLAAVPATDLLGRRSGLLLPQHADHLGFAEPALEGMSARRRAGAWHRPDVRQQWPVCSLPRGQRCCPPSSNRVLSRPHGDSCVFTEREPQEPIRLPFLLPRRFSASEAQICESPLDR